MSNKKIRRAASFVIKHRVPLTITALAATTLVYGAKYKVEASALNIAGEYIDERGLTEDLIAWINNK